MGRSAPRNQASRGTRKPTFGPVDDGAGRWRRATSLTTHLPDPWRNLHPAGQAEGQLDQAVVEERWPPARARRHRHAVAPLEQVVGNHWWQSA